MWWLLLRLLLLLGILAVMSITSDILLPIVTSTHLRGCVGGPSLTAVARDLGRLNVSGTSVPVPFLRFLVRSKAVPTDLDL